MLYKVIMPQLSDSMEEGKLVSWKKKVGDEVKVGDVVAEVESDKAIMEVQTFKNGVIKELLLKEGEEAKVGSVIATIETDTDISKKQVNSEQSNETKKEEKDTKHTDIDKKNENNQIKDISHDKQQKEKEIKHINIDEDLKSKISPKAKVELAKYNIDVKKLLQTYPNQTIHLKDVEDFVKRRYFTPKALHLLEKYNLDIEQFDLNHKIAANEIEEFISKHNIFLSLPLTSMQKAIISNVTESAKKPIYHIYEMVDASLLSQSKNHSITAWFIKILAKVMMKYDSFRSKIDSNTLKIYPNANISVAVSDEKNLYMPVIKEANRLSISEISKRLEEFKSKLKSKSFTSFDMEGGNFGISNLGMLKIARFDAMINKNESGIVAVGSTGNGVLNITLTIDHRLINGHEGALFVYDLKKEFENKENFKET